MAKKPTAPKPSKTPKSGRKPATKPRRKPPTATAPTATSAPAESSATQPSAVAESTATPTTDVSIRMYCQGLGDCFLLTFPTATGTTPIRVLIDCDVLQHTPGEAAKMKAVADHIARDTGGVIDLLVVTHEHWDHVAGFSHAKDVFARLTIKNVWLSWAENPEDPEGRNGHQQEPATALGPVHRPVLTMYSSRSA
jgi:phosphoribosyl 1,2-cyclic phosphodiesterase